MIDDPPFANWEQLVIHLEADAVPCQVGSCGRVTCEPTWHWQVHLQNYDLWFALQGRGEAWVNQQHYAIQPGTLFLLRPQDQVCARHNPQDCLTVLFLHLDFFYPGTRQPAHFPTQWLPPRQRVMPQTGFLDALLTRSIRLHLQQHPLAQLEANLLLRQALLEIYRQDASARGSLAPVPENHTQRVVDAMLSHPAQRMTLEEAARLAGLSPKYFSACFTRQVGTSFRAFQLRVRLERSFHLLSETSLSVGSPKRSSNTETRWPTVMKGIGRPITSPQPFLTSN